MEKTLFIVLTCSVFYNHATYGSSHVSDSPTYPEATSESNRAISPLSTSISDSEIEKELDEFSPEPITVFFEGLSQFNYDFRFLFLATIAKSPSSLPLSAILAKTLLNTMEEGDGFTNSEVDIFDFIAHETPALYDYIRENVESIHSKFGIIPDEQLPKLIEEFKAYYEKFTLSDEPLPHFAAQSMGWTPLKYNTIRLLLEHIKQNSKIENSRKRASYFLNKLEYGRVFSQNDEQILSIITLKAHKLFKNLSEYCEQYYPDSFLNDSEIEKIIKASKTQSESSSTSEGSHCETVSTEPKSGTPKVG